MPLADSLQSRQSEGNGQVFSNFDEMSDHLLEAFLEAQGHEGRYFDTAAFTLDSVKALQKLGQHQLADSGLWLVKLIQAAVALGSDQVVIAFAHRTVMLSFRASADWQADKILETVLSGTLPKDRALRHLVTGIRGCASSPNEAVKWSCGQAEVDLAGVCRVTKQPATEVFSLTASRPARSRSWSKFLLSSVSELSQQVVEERDALRSRCWLCPIPIIVDGVSMPTGVDLVKGGESPNSVRRLFQQRERTDGYVLSACLGYRYLKQPKSGETLKAPSQIQQASTNSKEPYHVGKPVHRYGTFLTWDRTDKDYRGAVALICHAHAESQIHFVHDGVIVQRHPLPELTVKSIPSVICNANQHPPVAIRFVFPLSEEQLDLSGFAVQESVPVNDMMYSCFGPILQMADALSEQSRAFTYVPCSAREAVAMKVAATGGVLLLSVLTYGIGFPIGAGGAWAFVGINRAQWRRQLRHMMKNLHKRLVDNLQAHKQRVTEV